MVAMPPTPSGFSDLPMALICKYSTKNSKIYCLLVSRIKMNSMSMRDCRKREGGGEVSVSPSSFCQIYQPYSNQGGQNLPA